MYLSAPGYVAPERLRESRFFVRQWSEGDHVDSLGVRRHNDSGMVFQLVKGCGKYDWSAFLERSIVEFCDWLNPNGVEALAITPQLSILVEHDGADLPPINLSKLTVRCLSSIGAEIDVDVVNCL